MSICEWLAVHPAAQGAIVAIASSAIFSWFLLNYLKKTTSPGPAPTAELEHLFLAQYHAQPSYRRTGFWVGIFETLIFFGAAWEPGAWALAAGWLAFKVVLHWESTNFTKLPDTMPVGHEAAWTVWKQRLGHYYASRLLVGTSLNIAIAMITAEYFRPGGINI